MAAQYTSTPTPAPALVAPSENSNAGQQALSSPQGPAMTTPSAPSAQQVLPPVQQAPISLQSGKPVAAASAPTRHAIMRTATATNAPVLTSAAAVRHMPTVPPPTATPPPRPPAPTTPASTPTSAVASSAASAAGSTLAAQAAVTTSGGKRKPSASSGASTSVDAAAKRARSDGTSVSGVVAAGAPTNTSGLGSYLTPLSAERASLLASESTLFMQLLALERRVDQALVRKQLELAEPSRFRPGAKPTKTLRLLLSCILTNQGATYHVDDSSLHMSLAEPPHWALRLEGVLVDPVTGTPALPPRRRFSAFVRRAVIELTHKVSGTASHTEVVEWDRDGLPVAVPSDGVDGLEVVRRGAGDVKARILLWMEHSPPRFRLAAPLAALLGLHTESKSRIVTALWQYIKLHKLQDPEDRKLVRLNAELRQLLGGAEVLPFSALPDLLGPLLAPPDPIEIHYEVHISGKREGTAARENNEEAYDVPVEIDDSSTTVAMRNECEKLDAQITQYAAAVEEHRPRRDFLRSFAAHPRDCLHALVHAHAHDLAMRAAPPAGPDFERTAFHFLQPLAPIAAQHYLSSQPLGSQS